jgi:plastocyanin
MTPNASTTNRDGRSTTRRGFLVAGSATGAALAAGSIAMGQDGDEDETTTVVLGGETAHWFGLAPDPIHGEENPTLRLQSGQRYEVVWVNLDGVEHEFVVEDADGNAVARSESETGVGETESVLFTATDEMAGYYCEYHPDSMQGDVALGEGFEAADNQTTPADGNRTGDETNRTGGDTTTETPPGDGY